MGGGAKGRGGGQGGDEKEVIQEIGGEEGMGCK